MIITIIPSIYCVPGIVLSALPMLLYLTHITVKCKLHGQIRPKTPLFLFWVGGQILLNPQDLAWCLAHSQYSINIHWVSEWMKERVDELQSCRVGFISPSHFADKVKGSHRLCIHHHKGEHERIRIWTQVCLVPRDPETSDSRGWLAIRILWRTSTPERPGPPPSTQSRQYYLKISWDIPLLYITWSSTIEKQKQVPISDCMWGLQGDMFPHNFLLNNAFPSKWKVVPAQPSCLILITLQESRLFLFKFPLIRPHLQLWRDFFPTLCYHRTPHHSNLALITTCVYLTLSPPQTRLQASKCVFCTLPSPCMESAAAIDTAPLHILPSWRY